MTLAPGERRTRPVAHSAREDRSGLESQREVFLLLAGFYGDRRAWADSDASRHTRD